MADSYHFVGEGVKWLLLDLNSYFASCEQQARPELRHRPVAVVPMIADTTCCIAASYEAKRFGVKTGTQVGEAKRMCPDLVLVPARHELYVRFHHQILEATERCLPISSVLSIDEMACELTGSHQQLAKALDLSHQIKESIQSRVGEAMKCSIGISTNRFLAKVASDMQKPDGLTVLLKEGLPDSLFKLKLRDLPGVGAKMEERLLRHGVVTVKQLCSLNQDQIRKVWGGINGERFYFWLRGVELSIPTGKTKSIGHEHVLPPDARNKNGSAATLKKLLAKAAMRMRKEKYYVRKLGIKFKFTNPTTYWEQSMRFTETQDSIFLLQVLNKMLKDCPRGQPLKVGIVLFDLISEKYHQLPMWEDPKRINLIEAMDAINAKYGKDTLHFGATLDQLWAAEPRIAFARVPELDEFSND